MLDRTRRTVTDDHVVVVLLANHELAHARKDTCQLSPCIMRFSAVQAADHAPNGLKRGEGGMRDVLRAHCGRVVALALHWWTSHWSQVRVEVCLKSRKAGAKFRFLRVWGAGNGHFCPKLKWGTVLGGNLLWFHLDF